MGDLTTKEQEIQDHIVAAVNGIAQLDDGLKFNHNQLAIGAHMLQQFLQQRVLHRENPEAWSDWYAE